MEKKEMYVAPEVEILEVSVEKGFAASPTTTIPDDGEWGGGGGCYPRHDRRRQTKLKF